MNRNLAFYLSLPIILLCIPRTGALAQTPDYSDMADQISSRTTLIRGSENPERISFILKMQLFFQNYHANYSLSIDPYLTTSDKAKIETFMRETVQYEKINTLLDDQAYLQLCANLGREGVVQASRVLDSMASRINTNSEDRFRKLLKSLSPDGKYAIENHIATNVTPNMVQTSVDSPSLVEEFPDFYLAQFKYVCETPAAERQQRFSAFMESQGEQDASTAATTSAGEAMGTIPE